MAYLIDILLICVIVVIAAAAAKRGFVRSALEFVFSFISLSVSWMAASMSCEWVYQQWVRQRVLTYLRDDLLPRISDTASLKAESLIQLIPESIRSLGEYLGLIDKDAVLSLAEPYYSAYELEQAFFSPVLIFLIKCLLFALLAVFLGIVLRFAAKRINRAVRNSPLRGVNTLLGGVFGVLRGAIAVFVLALILTGISCLAVQSQFAELVAQSKICSFAVEILNQI